jgi:hypothetical protein
VKNAALLFALLLASTPAHAAKLVFKASENDAIVAEPQKPEVSVFVARKNLNKAYDFEFKFSFIEKIIEAANKPPF